MLELRGVSKRYASLEAVRPTDLRVPRGETTVLIGASGSGKSTLLRMIVGLVLPDSGSVSIDGEQLCADNLRALRHRMGYVIQDGGLFPHLDGRSNVALLARHLGWDEPRIEARLRALTELTRLPVDALDRFPSQLSGGQCQRVSLMRALMLDPDMLLLDEPLGALDALIRAELQEDLVEIFRELGKTVVMVTHDIGEAAFFGDHIVLLHDGAILQRGSMQQLIDSPADPFVTRFIRAQRRPILGPSARDAGDA
jgi:osmoprotectant transport system ATP-binding protein